MDSHDHKKEEYDGVKMRDNEQPSLFIAQMERLKIKMQEKKHNVSDKEFMHNILSKLPESESSSMMNPYQIKKLIIKEKLTSAHTVDNGHRKDAPRECRGSKRKERIK